MLKEVTLKTPPDVLGSRIDSYLAGSRPELGLSRSRIQELIREGLITVEGKPVKPHHKLSGSETVEITIPDLKPLDVLPADIPISVLYEDADLIVVDKPAGMVVHPAPGNREGTLVNALLHHCKDLSGIGGVERPGIVHRLDKDTSGAMIAAKNDQAHRNLSSQLKSRKIRKVYWAVVRGRMIKDAARIEAPIGRHERQRKKMTTHAPRGREALTLYDVQERFEDCTLLKLELKTGRTHQIRVHLSSIHHPIVGDPVYGGKHFRKVFRNGEERSAKRQMLHSGLIGFVHPRTGEYMEFRSELPPDMQEVIEFLRGGPRRAQSHP